MTSTDNGVTEIRYSGNECSMKGNKELARNIRAMYFLFLLYILLFASMGIAVDLTMSRSYGSGFPLSGYTIILIIGLLLLRGMIGLAVSVSGGWRKMFRRDSFAAVIFVLLSVWVIWVFSIRNQAIREEWAELNVPKNIQSVEERERYIDDHMYFYYSYPYATMAGLLFGAIGSLLGYRKGTGVLLGIPKYAEPNMNIDRHIRFVEAIHALSASAGIVTPRPLILSDPDPNAFSIGTSGKNKYIVVTSGLLKSLEPNELQAVVAHEVSHIKNRDTEVMTLLSVLFGSVMFLSLWGNKLNSLGMSIKRQKISWAGSIGGFLLTIVWSLVLLCTPYISRLLATAICRRREYLADSGAIELTGDADAFRRALETIEGRQTPTKSVKQAIEHLCIVDPLGIKINEKKGFWSDVFSTHPPIAKRLMNVDAMAYQLKNKAITV
ncbi:MAG: M48 family metalloprotease [Ignavibacteriae bacterium]|nr:M48 family metalloprotease [Ignavibacteriota bacterium]